MKKRRESLRQKRGSLRGETLEARRLLATIEVFASGLVGNESFDLKIDNQLAESFTLQSTQPEILSFETIGPVTADRIQIAFTNGSDPIDRDLTIDKIAIDDVEFQTEHPSTFSTGTINPANAAAMPGRWQSETLNVNGFFAFANQAATTIEVHASGATGLENMRLLIRNDQEIASWDVTTSNQVYTVILDELIDPAVDSIQVEYTNDFVDPVNRQLLVDKIVVNGVALESEAATTYSAVPAPGYLLTETLADDGAFQYLAPPSTINIRASGDEGTEQFSLLIDGQSVQTYNVTTSFATINYPHTGPLSPNQIRIDYSGDIYDPGNGIDTNVNVDWIEVDAVRYETESPFVFSTGTWSPIDQAIVPGFGRGETLHYDGYLQYATGSTIDIRAQGLAGTETFDLWIDGQNVGSYDVSTTLATFRYIARDEVKPSDVRIEYADVSASTSLTVDWIEISGERFETEAETTFSSGTGLVGPNVDFGFGKGATLVESGFFQFRAVELVDTDFSIAEDSIAVPLAVIANSPALGFTTEIDTFSNPTNGTLTLLNGVLRYTPNADFDGSDSFTYNILSNGGAQPPTDANVTITVNESHQQAQHLVNPSIAAELTPSGKFLEVKKLAQLPRGDSGRHARMNSMTTMGDQVFIVTDGVVQGESRIFELVVDAAGNTTAELFLDAGPAILAATGLQVDNSSPLNGLRSVAFHPEFASNGKFYTSYTGVRPADPSGYFYLSDPATPDVVDGVLAEWTYDFLAGAVDTTSYREIFRVGMTYFDHSIQNIVFNKYAHVGDADYGMLYVGHGDGSEQSAVAGDGQGNDALGKILRINPLQDGSQPYSVPGTNPFVGDPTMIDEVYALGFRNPHNLAFARDSSGEIQLILTEVGRDNIEEVNVIVAGENYGWAEREGVFVHLKGQVGANGSIDPLPLDEANNGYVFPVAMLGHEAIPGETFVGQAIAGSHVIQNGSTELDDQFVFLEFATDGRAYHIDFSDALQQINTLDPLDPLRDEPDELTWLTPQELTILFDHDSDDSTLPLVRDSLKDVLDDEPDFEVILTSGKVRADLRLNEGPHGEIYILNKRNGWVYVATNTVAPDGQVLTVTNNSDELDPNDTDLRTFDPNDLSLREAITLANIDPATSNVINFDFAGAGPHLIAVTSPLPAITGPITIDGTSEPDYAGTPVVGIDGSSTGSGADGLKLLGSNSTITGLAIYGFSGWGSNGIEASGGSNNTITQNYVGLDTSGTANGNYHGIKLLNSTNNTIDNNVLSGNQHSGMFIIGPADGKNVVINNKMGTDPDGLAARPNGMSGLTIYSPANQIGRPGEGNLISGNKRGIYTYMAGRGENVIQGNWIGVDDSGSAAIPNSTGLIVRTESNQIGGSGVGEENVISGNLASGIFLYEATANNNVVQGNLIGTDASGTIEVGNGSDGIRIVQANDNTIGGSGTDEGNLISGNNHRGLLIMQSATNNQVIGNQIGTEIAGNAALANAKGGVRFITGASGNTLQNNQISGNGQSAVTTSGATTSGNDILFNLIGTDAAGTDPLHNGAGGALRLVSPNMRIEGNTISSVDAGIVAWSQAVDYVIKDNFIGTDATGASATLGMTTGINFNSGSVNATVTGNVIANNVNGISVTGGAGHTIQDNSIYDNSSIGIDLGSNGATANDAGDVDSGANNLQNTPVISSATLSGSTLTIQYLVDSLTNASAYDLSIEFFVSDGNGQGKTLVVTDTYLAANAGNNQSTPAVTVVGVNVGDKLVATATDSDGNTSEFGAEFIIA